MRYSELYLLTKQADLKETVKNIASRASDILHMRGAPYKNTLDYSKIQQGLPVYIGIGGCFAGDLNSFLSKAGNPGSWMQSLRPNTKSVRFRHDDRLAVDNAINTITARGGTPVILAHSWGTKLGNLMLNKHRGIKGVFIDPVSWRFGRPNRRAKVYFAGDKYNFNLGNVAALLGHRVDSTKFMKRQVKLYPGGHNLLGKAMAMEFGK